MKAYKLKEIADQEGKHYQTILKAKKDYIKIEIDRGKRKPLVRYLDRKTSEAIKSLQLK